MIRFKLQEGVEMPKYAKPGDSGMDVIAYDILAMPEYEVIFYIVKEGLWKLLKKRVKLNPNQRILFDTGIEVADMSEDLEIQVRSRSGLSLNQGLIVLNEPGTIDSGYRGKIGVILYNSSNESKYVGKGDRIAQLVITKVHREVPEISNEIIETERSSNGFGSTGLN